MCRKMDIRLLTIISVFIFSRPVSFSMNGLVILGLSDTVEDLCFHLSIDILINIWKQNALDMRIMMQ